MGIITQAHLDMARMAGACDQLGKYRAGMPIHAVHCDDLQWFSWRFPRYARVAAKRILESSGIVAVGNVPLALFGYGYGYGYGYDSGSGSGSGSGYGYGYGYGDGSGDGDGQ